MHWLLADPEVDSESMPDDKPETSKKGLVVTPGGRLSVKKLAVNISPRYSTAAAYKMEFQVVAGKNLKPRPRYRAASGPPSLGVMITGTSPISGMHQ